MTTTKHSESNKTFADVFSMSDLENQLNSLTAVGYDHFTELPIATDPDNKEKRLCAVILMDTSTSVSKCLPQIKSAVKRMILTILNNPTAVERVELSLITFSNSVRVVLPLQEVYNYGDTVLDASVERAIDDLRAGGRTYTGPALLAAADHIRAREKVLRENARDIMIPLLIVMTDGLPCYNDDFKEEGEKIFSKICNVFETSRSNGTEDEKIHVVTFSVGSQNDESQAVIRKIAGENTISLDDGNFDRLFDAIATSVVRTSQNGFFNIQDLIDW